jgi:hypothetical protein
VHYDGLLILRFGGDGRSDGRSLATPPPILENRKSRMSSKLVDNRPVLDVCRECA